MTFAFDLDGTITRHPKQMDALMRGLLATGHYVIILTGVCSIEPPNGRDMLLARAGLRADIYHEMVRIIIDGKADDHEKKAIYCRAHAVDFLVDDNIGWLNEVRRLSPNTACLHVIA